MICSLTIKMTLRMISTFPWCTLSITRPGLGPRKSIILDCKDISNHLASSSASKRARQIPTHGSDSYQRLLGWTSVSNKCNCMGSFNSYISFTLNAVRIHLIVIQCYNLAICML